MSSLEHGLALASLLSPRLHCSQFVYSCSFASLTLQLGSCYQKIMIWSTGTLPSVNLHWLDLLRLRQSHKTWEARKERNLWPNMPRHSYLVSKSLTSINWQWDDYRLLNVSTWENELRGCFVALVFWVTFNVSRCTAPYKFASVI